MVHRPLTVPHRVATVADHPPVTEHLTVASAAVVVVSVVVAVLAAAAAVASEEARRLPLMEPQALVDPHQAPMVPPTAAAAVAVDHRPTMEHLPVADRRAHTVHQTDSAAETVEDLPAAMALLEVVTTTLVALLRRTMAHHPVETVVAGRVQVMGHPATAEDYLVAMVHLTGAVAMDPADHLPLTVHLATVVAVTQGKMFTIFLFYWHVNMVVNPNAFFRSFLM